MNAGLQIATKSAAGQGLDLALVDVTGRIIEAMAAIGRRDEARAMFNDLLERRNRFGLLSEDIHPDTGSLWGNFPQTYSMAGIINSATRLSRKWEDIWCRASS